jgi:hypothetical protein
MDANTLELTTQIFVILHLIGLASLLGGFLTQMKSLKTGGTIVPAILHGAWLLAISGFALVGLVQMNSSEQINNWVLAAKSVVITAIFFLAYGFNKKEKLAKWVLPTIGALSVLNICLAVLGPIVVDAA